MYLWCLDSWCICSHNYFLMHILSQGSAFGPLLFLSLFFGDPILFRGFKYNLSVVMPPKYVYLVGPRCTPHSRLRYPSASLTSLPVISQASSPQVCQANVHPFPTLGPSVNFCISDSPVVQLSRSGLFLPMLAWLLSYSPIPCLVCRNRLTLHLWYIHDTSKLYHYLWSKPPSFAWVITIACLPVFLCGLLSSSP